MLAYLLKVLGDFFVVFKGYLVFLIIIIRGVWLLAYVFLAVLFGPERLHFFLFWLLEKFRFFLFLIIIGQEITIIIGLLFRVDNFIRVHRGWE